MCTVHKTVRLLSCYMNNPKYSKLFIQIIRETSFRETSYPGNFLSGKVIVRETSVTRCDIRTQSEIGKRAFNVAIPTVWNRLPSDTVTA